MKKKLNVLVTDGENRSSLAVTRSLGSAGHIIYVSSKNKQSISGVSKFCRKSFRTSDPENRIDQYIQEIIDLTDKESIDIIIPTSESTIYALNTVRNNITANCLIACPESAKFDSISNKFELFKKAEKCGVPIPKTIFIENKNDLCAKIHQVTNYPVVIKPGKSKFRKGNGYISSSVKYAGSEAEILEIYRETEVLNYPSMIQEKIKGPGTGLFTIFDKDKHLVLFSHQRLREKPPSGGVSVVCKSIDIDEEMVEASQKMLSSVNWPGVAMVEFKKDIRDGKSKLMEINGRFWGSLQLAISSGVNFPRLLIDYLYSKPFPSNFNEYAKNMKMKWFLGTLDHLFIRLKNNDLNSAQKISHKSRFCALIEFLKICDSKTSFDVLNSNDLRPFLTELKQYLGFSR